MTQSNTQKHKIPQNNVDIVLLTLPRLELRCPITAPAILKSSVETAGYKAFCIDLNLDLWQKIDCLKYGHIWFDTDLTFRRQEIFTPFWNEIIKPCAEKWVDQVSQLDPRWVGITIFSQRSKWISFSLCKMLKERLPHIKIVAGGPFSKNVSPGLLKNNLIDAYVVGEGEESLVHILKGEFDNPGINHNPPAQIKDLNSIPIPNYDDFDFKKYPKAWSDPRVKDEKKMGTDYIYITGSRGCVRKCEFCDIQSIWPKFRFRSGNNIAQEMKSQNLKYGSRRFMFTDSLLNGSIKQLKELCAELIKYKNEASMANIAWQGQFIARPESQMNDDIYRMMKEAGCFFVSIGVESGSEKVRNDMKKMFDNDALDYTFRACAKNNIEMAWLLLVGYPTETEEDFQETLNLLDKYQWINKLGLIRSIALGPTLDIVPGSPLYNKQKELNITWDKNKNWVYKDNCRVTRIKRWLRLKEKCLELGYPVVEKATEHLLMELERYTATPSKLKVAPYSDSSSPGSMDRND